jgi:hypothetical protein
MRLWSIKDDFRLLAWMVIVALVMVPLCKPVRAGNS